MSVKLLAFGKAVNDCLPHLSQCVEANVYSCDEKANTTVENKLKYKSIRVIEKS